MTSLPLTYKANNCYINAFINLRHHYKGKGLKLVIGSLGINRWFEFGGRDWTKSDFAKKMSGSFQTDSHCWLEDKDGNIYDYLFDDYDFWVKFRTNKPMRRKGLLEGVSKTDLRAVGIQYIPADKDTQQMLFLHTYKHCCEAERRLLDGSSEWCGDSLAYNISGGGFSMDDIVKALANTSAVIRTR
jgi:hypothetical protein